MKGIFFGTGLAVFLSALALGCSQTQDRAAKVEPKKDDHHLDKPGLHGGTVVVIGNHDYHAEIIAVKGGTLRILMLGKDEKQIQEVDRQKLTAYLKAESDLEATPLILEADPQPGDADGKTSQFVGKLPAPLQGTALTGTVANITIAGKRFPFDFRLGGSGHDGAMPTSLDDEEARKLYLSPAGRYTEADIAANGRQTAPQKYKGFRAKHDMKPKPGEKICPVTFTKANAACTWIVDGKTYEFCCPPCIDEFVALAKEQPDEIRPPEHFVKKGSGKEK
jgi:YHS domain-containing protein